MTKAKDIVRVQTPQLLNGRIVGGKRYCAKHGVAHLESAGGRCPVCVTKAKPPQHYENIVMVSRTQARASRSGEGSGKWDGKDGRLFIGEVISLHVVDSRENIAKLKAGLRKQHGY
jgi:hypothetical protein